MQKVFVKHRRIVRGIIGKMAKEVRMADPSLAIHRDPDILSGTPVFVNL
jgi:hypothetical protein